MPTTLSLLVVFIILGLGFGFSYRKMQEDQAEAAGKAGLDARGKEGRSVEEEVGSPAKL